MINTSNIYQDISATCLAWIAPCIAWPLNQTKMGFSFISELFYIVAIFVLLFICLSITPVLATIVIYLFVCGDSDCKSASAWIGPICTFVVITLELAIFAWIISVLLARRRTSLREFFNIKGTASQDTALYVFCFPCALAQETRTLWKVEDYRAIPVAEVMPQEMV